MSSSLEQKIATLTGAAKYDVSCASSGSKARHTARGPANATPRGGICHSWSDDGRCISLLKILMSNRCIYNCAYCLNRCSNALPRAALTVNEIVDLTLAFYRRNYIEGLFLSSGVDGSPNATMENMLRVAQKLRENHAFRGYIHLKAIPGADPTLIARAGYYADRMSVNIELPSAASLQQLAPDKSKHDILLPMRTLTDAIAAHHDERARTRKAPPYVPAGQSTQMIVGASPESDATIITLSDALYRTYKLKRVYYSAYAPVGDPARIGSAPASADLIREHRLYQADWLMRLYGFEAQDILDDSSPDLPRDIDPKAAWALRHLETFPVEIHTADYESLLRVPGIGIRSAKRILATRRVAPLSWRDLTRIGVVMKRAQFFISLRGHMCVPTSLSIDTLRAHLAPARSRREDAYTCDDLFAAVNDEV